MYGVVPSNVAACVVDRDGYIVGGEEHIKYGESNALFEYGGHLGGKDLCTLREIASAPNSVRG